MNALKDEPCIEFDNHFRRTRLILDLRDLNKNPQLWKCEVPLDRIVGGNAVTEPRSCKMTDPCP